MTATAAEKFTQVTQSGVGSSWSGLSNLVYGSSGEANVVPSVSYGTKEIAFAVPNFITSLASGGEFISIKIIFKEKGNVNRVCKLTGGSDFTNAPTSSYATITLDGDAMYWGLSGTAQEIFTGLKAGTIKFLFDTYGSGTYMYVKDVTAQLTYVDPDTKRASLMTVAL